MDVAFDMSYVVPALLFTLLAIVFASVVFNKKPISASQSKTEREVTKMGLTEKDNETKDLATGLIHKADKVKADEVVAAGRNTRIKERTNSALVTPAENIGVLLEHPGTECVNRSIQVRPEAKKSDVKDPVPETVPQKGTVDEALPEAVPVEEAPPRLLPEAAQDWEATSEVTPAGGPHRVPDAEPREEETRELLTDHKAESSPVSEEQCVIGAASEEEGYQSLKYAPGKLRTSQLEDMMSKEEREEEQRVQREQLAAIFQLLKDNKETFGEVTEGDVEEQLKLYSI